MPLVISGKLSLPVTGQPASNAQIRFRAVTAVGEIIPGAESVARCGADGTYSISIEFARYELATKVSTPEFNIHGNVTINSDTQASDLEDLITLIGVAPSLSDELINKFNTLTARAEKAASDAENSAQSASSDAQSANASLTAITPMYQYFSSNYPIFETNYSDFQVKYPDVVSKHAEVVTLAGETVTNADLAEKWATNPEDSPVETGKYSALHWAEKAKYNANQTFISGGLFTPTSSQEYPDVSAVVRDTIWIIEFSSHNDTYTFTGGQLSGDTVKNGDMIFWDTPQNTWSIIPTSISGVLSVNGKPGPAPVITAADIGAPALDGDNNISVNTVKMSKDRHTGIIPSYATIPFRNNTTNDSELKFANLDTVKSFLNYSGADFDITELKYSGEVRAETSATGLDVKNNGGVELIAHNTASTDPADVHARTSAEGFVLRQAADAGYLISTDGSGNNPFTSMRSVRGGASELWHNNTKRFETADYGALITGDCTVEGQRISIINALNGPVFFAMASTDQAVNRGIKITQEANAVGAVQSTLGDGSQPKSQITWTYGSGTSLHYDDDAKISTIETGVSVNGQGIFTRNGDAVTLKGTLNGVSAAPILRYKQGDNSDIGYIGYSSSSNSDLYVANGIGNLHLSPVGATYINNPESLSAQGNTGPSLIRKDYLEDRLTIKTLYSGNAANGQTITVNSGISTTIDIQLTAKVNYPSASEVHTFSVSFDSSIISVGESLRVLSINSGSDSAVLWVDIVSDTQLSIISSSSGGWAAPELVKVGAHIK
jgi:hypothetical protein